MGKKEYKNSKHVDELNISDEYNKIHTSLLKNLDKTWKWLKRLNNSSELLQESNIILRIQTQVIYLIL